MDAPAADQSVSQPSISDAMHAHDLEEGALVLVIGRVRKRLASEPGFPDTVQVRFISSTQPVGGASFVCVPVDLCRPADIAIEPDISIVREAGGG